MKKRLLITSVVMMLVVAVALATSTYAWFTSNATVKASSVNLTAATNAASALGIGWAGGDAGTSISHEVSGILEPMAPEALTVDTTSAAGTASTVKFRTATTKEEGSQIVFNSGVAETTNQKLFGNGTVSAFYIKNLSPSNDISKVTVTAVFGEYSKTTDVALNTAKTYYTLNEGTYSVVAEPVLGDIGTYYESTSAGANDLIRVAIFTKDATTGASSAEAYTLLGVLGATATTGTAVGEGSFNKNTTYFTRTGTGEDDGPYVYTQDKTVSAENFASKKATLYTCANTAAYGVAGLFDQGDAVKDLDYFADVRTSLDIVTTRTSGATTLAAGKQVDIVAVVWLDGTTLTDARKGQVGQVSLSFSA